MKTAATTAWVDYAMGRLDVAGYRKGEARSAVVGLLGSQDCAVTAQEIDEKLRRRRAAVGRASVYRVLEQLEELGLVRKLDVARGTASYERVEPSGDHHHHVVCRHCGRIEPFEDTGLERAIARVSRKLEFEVDEHDVVLRGHCLRCSD